MKGIIGAAFLGSAGWLLAGAVLHASWGLFWTAAGFMAIGVRTLLREADGDE